MAPPRSPKLKTFTYADGHTVQDTSPPEDLILEWTLEMCGWSKEAIASMNPTQTNLSRLFDKNGFYTDVQNGLIAFSNRRKLAGKGAYPIGKHVVWKKLDDNYELLKETFKDRELPPPPPPPPPPTWTEERFTAKGKLPESGAIPKNSLAKYRYTYGMRQINVGFGREGTYIVTGKQVVHKEFLGWVNMESNEIVPEKLTKSARKAFKEFKPFSFNL